MGRSQASQYLLFLCITKESRLCRRFFFDIFAFVLITGKNATVTDTVQTRHFSFSQLLAHCFNVDFSLHPKIIDILPYNPKGCIES